MVIKSHPAAPSSFDLKVVARRKLNSAVRLLCCALAEASNRFKSGSGSRTKIAFDLFGFFIL
jgi:hypothetical protein